MIGLAQGAFNKAMQYIWDRKQFGKSIGDNQGCVPHFDSVGLGRLEGRGIKLMRFGFGLGCGFGFGGGQNEVPVCGCGDRD